MKSRNFRHTNPLVIEYVNVVRHARHSNIEIGNARVHHNNKAEVKKTKVVLKHLSNAFRDVKSAERAYRELALLEAMRRDGRQKNLIQLFDVQLPADVATVEDMHKFDGLKLITVHHSFTLDQMLHEQPINMHSLISRIAFHLLCGLNYLHKFGVIHRDLKPNNIVCDEKVFKIIDYGICRGVTLGPSERMAPNIGCYMYMAPEVLIGLHKYTTKIDMWSLGCIIAQVLLGHALFSGKCANSQWEQITTFLGPTDFSYLDEAQRAQINAKILALNSSLGQQRRAENFDEIFANEKLKVPNNANTAQANNQLRDLLAQLIAYDPGMRSSAEMALEHAYFERLRNNKHCQELIINPVGTVDFGMISGTGTIEEWKKIIFHKCEEIRQNLERN